jgi:hypothetical protein
MDIYEFLNLLRRRQENISLGLISCHSRKLLRHFRRRLLGFFFGKR